MLASTARKMLLVHLQTSTSIDTALLIGLNLRLLSVIKKAQRQQQANPGRLSVPILLIFLLTRSCP